TPEALFDGPGYKATGSLFSATEPSCRAGAKDRTGSAPTNPSCPTYLGTRSFRGTTAHEQESGVIGFELVQEPYAFVCNYGGIIGELKPGDDQSVCGAQMHLDYQGRPLWWNSGLVKSKNSDDYRDLYFGYWMSGGGNQMNRELVIRDEDMKAKLAYEFELDSFDDLPPPEEPVDPSGDFMRGCISGWKVEALREDEAERADSYVVMDKISRRAESLIAQTRMWIPKATGSLRESFLCYIFILHTLHNTQWGHSSWEA
ncbi:hypothetical protein BGW39_000486, partial [Mortierella sp. 14UC]